MGLPLSLIGILLKEKLKKLNRKKLVIILTITSLCILLPFKLVASLIPGEDIAAAILDAVLEATMTVIWVLLLTQIVLTLSNLFVGLGGALLSWAINLNINIPLTHCSPGIPCIVDGGWALARDLANMFFILALVMIAFATILGIESYGMRRMLIPLILIALFVNFSQVLIGAVVDFASVFMEIFAEDLIDWASLVSMAFMAQGQMLTDLAMGLASPLLFILCPVCGIILGVADPFSVILSFLAKVLIVIAVNVLMGVILLTLAGLFLLRIPMIWILTIIAPMALVCYLFPFLKSKYKWWINQLGQWVFIGVFTLFFLYIGMFVWEQVWDASWANQWKTDQFGTGTYLAGLDRWLVENILPGIVFLLFLFIALHFAQKTNAIFATAIIGAGVALGKGLKGRIETGLQKYPRKLARERMAPKRLERRARLMERIPGLKGRAPALREEVYKKTKGYIEEGEKAGKRVSPEEAARMYWNNALGNPYKNIGLLSAHAKDIKEFRKEAARRGMSRDEIDRRLNESLILAGRYDPSTQKNLIKSDLYLATLPAARERVKASTRMAEVMSAQEQTQWNATRPGLAEEIASARLVMRDYVKPEDVENMDPEAFRYLGLRDAFLREGKLRHFERLGYNNPKARRRAQGRLNELIRTGELWNNPDYARLHEMLTRTNDRRRLSQAGWTIPNIPWRCPSCGHLNNRNATRCVKPGCGGRRPY